MKNLTVFFFIFDCKFECLFYLGKCVCSENFSGDDCSLDLRSSTRIIKTSFENNMCDVTKQNCSELLIFAEKLTSYQIMDSTLTSYSLVKVKDSFSLRT
jgi:hypothetical protein